MLRNIKQENCQHITHAMRHKKRKLSKCHTHYEVKKGLCGERINPQVASVSLLVHRNGVTRTKSLSFTEKKGHMPIVWHSTAALLHGQPTRALCGVARWRGGWGRGGVDCAPAIGQHCRPQTCRSQTCTVGPAPAPRRSSRQRRLPWCLAGTGWSRSPSSPFARLTHKSRRYGLISTSFCTVCELDLLMKEKKVIKRKNYGKNLETCSVLPHVRSTPLLPHPAGCPTHGNCEKKYTTALNYWFSTPDRVEDPPKCEHVRANSRRSFA